ncbi:MAG: cupredoxin domain-containing protein [Thermoflavifilum sp.]|nr:cupredoxin domain-containing protein [Thermoflavifilum sp.]MCL6514877.1 cupredoxin domain-containing protein [Alicyclobacillus sp.]
MMDRRWLIPAAAGLILLAAGCGSASSGGGNQTVQIPANAQTVHVDATDFKWTLDKTTLQAGVPVDFIVKSDEGAHGFSIAGTNISQLVVQGQPAQHVLWQDPKPGTYTILCDYFCGSGHSQMQATITVK